MRMMKKMDKERLDYLLDYANRLQGFQSIDSVHLHKEINEVISHIRRELGLESNKDELGKFTVRELADELIKRNSVVCHAIFDDGYAKIERQSSKISETWNDVIEGRVDILIIK